MDQEKSKKFASDLFLSLISGLIGVLIGIGIPLMLNQHMSMAEAQRIRKEEAYINLMEAATAFMKGNERPQAVFYEEYMKSWLYIDKNVNDAFLKFFDVAITEEGDERAAQLTVLLKEIAIEMRKSLGVKNNIPVGDFIWVTVTE